MMCSKLLKHQERHGIFSLTASLSPFPERGSSPRLSGVLFRPALLPRWSAPCRSSAVAAAEPISSLGVLKAELAPVEDQRQHFRRVPRLPEGATHRIHRTLRPRSSRRSALKVPEARPGYSAWAGNPDFSLPGPGASQALRQNGSGPPSSEIGRAHRAGDGGGCPASSASPERSAAARPRRARKAGQCGDPDFGGL